MDPDSELAKLITEEIRRLNVELNEDDRRTGLLAVKKAALKKETEKRAEIQLSAVQQRRLLRPVMRRLSWR